MDDLDRDKGVAKDQAIRTLRRAFRATRDLTQAREVARRLKGLGVDVSVADHIGFLRDWYVVGWCKLRDDRRLFRLDRIATISVLPDRVAERDLDEVLGWGPFPAERPSLLPDA